jgi:hypothetical protein
MNDAFTPFVIGLAGVGVAGFVAWVIGSIISLKHVHATLALHLSENYVKKDSFSDLQKEIKSLSQLMFEIAGKLGVPIRRD